MRFEILIIYNLYHFVFSYIKSEFFSEKPDLFQSAYFTVFSAMLPQLFQNASVRMTQAS